MAEFPSWFPFRKSEQGKKSNEEAQHNPLGALEEQIHAIGAEFAQLAPARVALVESEPDVATRLAIVKEFDNIRELEAALFTRPYERPGSAELDRLKSLHYRAREVASFRQDLWRHMDRIAAVCGIEDLPEKVINLEISALAGKPALEKYEEVLSRTSRACVAFLKSYQAAFPNNDLAMSQFDENEHWPYA